MRIVSLVPSISELLCYLDLEQETVGITKFCIHPESWHQSKPHIGGTKNIRVDDIRALRPDLIIASKEENVREQVEALSAFSEILLTDVSSFDDAIQTIRTIGRLCSKTPKANELADRITHQFDALGHYELFSAAYLIWKEPWMAVGADTFIHSMMERAGFKNVTGEQNRYPEITIEQLQQLQPQYILLSSEPYPFKPAHRDALQEQVPFSKVILVDGEMFSWYGSRMLLAANYIEELRHSLSPAGD